ncbi:MAG: SDR family NAD(P)-dependent oxidoreductase [Nitrospira sp. SB0678_bin_10]|nr:SDR family NAD(P)-dependent oxidoreductase [Nitrospira sp. SB0678_bin_10]
MIKKSSSPSEKQRGKPQGRKRKGSDQPIAIVGMACRFPGAPDISAFWRLLEAGENAVSEGVPGSGVGRWGQIFGDDAVQSEGCRFGAFVDDIELFDDSFFRISPVEAEWLDPQQRMMLETSWQALEDAGIDPEKLRESRTGVYAGISNDEYRMLVVDSNKPAEAAGCLYALSGTNLNGASGRVSFVLGLRGPAKAVDAACASSMVSIHDAVADLQQGKADLAIAGGVQAILNGRIYELRADSMMLSPDGQCKAFDASANGYVRGEGCGVIVLKRLSEAEADGDRIWAVIRGAAVNHGGASIGLTVPNTPALEEVMETALSDAEISPLEVDYLEAHGTGTEVGDPIEINAVAAVYGKGRTADRPLLIGSVKTNIGHLESAAGVAGVIKAALVLKRGVIPKHLHFRNPNPSLDWDRLPLQVTSSMMDLPQRPDRPRLAGVNSFGISGTNAHIVLEEYCAPDDASAGEPWAVGSGKPVPVTLPATARDLPFEKEGFAARKTRFLPLSGKSERALRELAERYVSWLDERAGDLSSEGAASAPLLADMAWTASEGRSHFEHRAGVVFHDAGSLRERLSALAEGSAITKPRTATRVAFAYTGQGSQWTGMGHALYESEPAARAVLDRCEAVLRDVRGASLLDVMFGRAGGEAELNDTAWEQPALYALECALTALWASAGIRPDVVLGHSIGELAAAQTAGVFSLEDGMRFACTRGELMSKMEEGAMAAVFAPGARVAAAVSELNAASSGVGLSISGDNGTHQVVSGPVADIESISQRFESEGLRVKRLNTAKAFHSALMEPALDALEASLNGVAIEPPSLTLVSNLTGRAVEPGEALDGAYWKRHAREPVAFASGVRTLADLGVDLVVEIGPNSVLAPMAVLAWPESAQTLAPAVLSSLRPPSGNEAAGDGTFVGAVAGAYAAGLPVRFAGLFAGETRRRVSVPGYPFQRQRHWIEAPKQRRRSAGHPLLGVRHESARGETAFETEVFPSDPPWLNDHRVFGRIIAPGALYGAMAASASLVEGNGSVVLEDVQLHNPLVFPEENSEDATDDGSRKMQVVLDAPEQSPERRVQVFSKGSEGEWTLHVEGRVSPDGPAPEAAGRFDLEKLKAGLSPGDVSDYYRTRAATGIDLGPSFRTLRKIWVRPGEALAEVSFPAASGKNGLDIHPLILDGCFQVIGVARLAGGKDPATYLPFGWERFWLTGPLPDRVVCHVRMSDASPAAQAATGEPAEVLTGEINIYDPSGMPLGGLSGYTVKRATRAALLSAVEGVKDLLYEVVWRERALPAGITPADFFPSPTAVAAGSSLLSEYLAAERVDPEDRNALLADLERWSRSRALATLEELGWQRRAGETVDPDDLRQRLNVIPEHRRLFRRMLEMLARSGVLAAEGDGFVVIVGRDDALPEEMPKDLEEFATTMAEQYPHGVTEVGLFRRCGGALAEVLVGRMDPLTLLFSSGDPTPADLYLKAPVARAANKMLRDAVRALLAKLPDNRRLRVVEVGAGTGSATTYILPELPEGRFDYTYTDISAGFFAEAEARFGDGGGCIEYRTLDVEKDPIAQGYAPHSYDLIIASNVLHATRYLQETLGHCRDLLAPSGQLVALENLSGLGWMDLTFGQLDGWWRFADDYRPHHALASPAVWRQALGDSGFTGAEVLGVDESDTSRTPDKGVIVAQGPAEVKEPRGVWVLAGDRGGLAGKLAADLAARNQTVVLASRQAPENETPAIAAPGVVEKAVEMEQRESWRSLMESLPKDEPLSGVVHLAALDGHGAEATTGEIAEDVRRVGASALALTQGISDADRAPVKGVWFVTRGAQILERERDGELAGATLWGFGKAVALEAPHLQPRILDLDPAEMAPLPDLVNELLYPDPENHIAYRFERRQVARLVRVGAGPERLSLPEEADWALAPDPGGVFEKPYVQPLPAPPLKPREVRVGVEASGLNFWDVFRSLGFIPEGNLGREMCGHILEVGSDVSTVSAGDHVVGLGFGAFAAQMVTHEELVAPAPSGASVTALATVPSAFVSAALSYEFSGLKAGDRVLIHAGAGGVGIAAIQMAQAAGAEVFATASAPKQAYLRSLGVEQIFDSRTTAFGREILEATDGAGVDVVLNSLTGEGFIDASLSCLKHGGRFVELARRDILSEEEMAAVRPDVAYAILELDVLKKTEPAWVGRVLRDVMARVSAGELKPIVHSRWPLAEAGAALRFMRSARHLGKIVVTAPPLLNGRLRQDRTYLVTGGLGGIGCAVAEWLADKGAGTIVLNGRRDPDEAAEETINALRERGVTVQVELADVSDAAAVDRMLERMDRELPPLGGVIHSVGVLSDAALTNQNWESFEKVLWPKILGGWHLHRATVDRDLDFFILFSSRVGVMGNPGQANHAAANAFLDQLAGHRRAMGLPAQAIAWGAWSEIGEAAEQKERIERRRAALGGRWFTPQQGLKALENLVRQDATTSVVMSMDWSVFAEAVADRPPLLEDLLSAVAEGKTDAVAASGDLLSRLRQTPAGTHEELLVSFLQREVQAVLRLPSTPAPTVGFFDLGMDSLMAVELRNRLNRAFSDEYTAPNTVVFDYPDIAALARHLVEALGEIGSAPAPQAQPEPLPAVRPEDDGIAIVGMACRFPGAPDLSAFWRLLEAGVNAVTDRRPGTDAWSDLARDIPTGYAAYCRGAFVDEIDKFDAGFFRITPIDARNLDPRHRMLLETSWQALEDAGMDPDRLRGSRTGIYAGIGTSEYRDLMTTTDYGISYLGTAPSMAVGRIAFHLGLEGPTVPVELNCASSLVALHHAVAGLQRGEVNMALVGGASAILSTGIIREMADLGMLSRTGACRTFDASADGFARGEGCGIIVLKRLAEAKADGDRIWGVIRGSAVNQNGASAGPTVPNGPVQERVIEEALSRAGVSPSDVDYLEAHGSASELGDTIEVQSAAAVYGKGRKADHALLIGSVKTNIGHLEPAAGVAGLIKVILAMNQGVIPRHLHFRDPNPNLEWDRLPVRVTSEATDWPVHPDRPPFAAVSAFGISGTNAHVVVEGNGTGDGVGSRHQPAGGAQPVAVDLPEPVKDLPLAKEGLGARKTRFLPLSGKSDGALRELASRYLSWLDEHALSSGDDTDPLLADMAWTAGVGRSHFNHRAGVVFRDAASLREGLRKLETGRQTEPRAPAKVAFAYTGQAGQWAGMGHALYESEPVVRAVLDRCDSVLREAQDDSLLDVLFGQAPGDPNDAARIQPAIYALECALTALWASIGIRPSVVVGHNLGELAAAQAAWMFGLEDGLRFAAARGALIGGLPEVGAQTAALDDLQATLDGIAIAPPSLTLVSSMTGKVVEPGKTLDPAYWRCQASEPTATDRCAETVVDLGVETIVQIGPRTTPASAADNGEAPVVLSCLPGTFVEAVAGAYEAGLPVSFAGLFAGEARRRIALPGYPFQRRRYWIATQNRQ